MKLQRENNGVLELFSLVLPEPIQGWLRNLAPIILRALVSAWEIIVFLEDQRAEIVDLQSGELKTCKSGTYSYILFHARLYIYQIVSSHPEHIIT